MKMISVSDYVFKDVLLTLLRSIKAEELMKERKRKAKERGKTCHLFSPCVIEDPLPYLIPNPPFPKHLENIIVFDKFNVWPSYLVFVID